MGSGPAWEPALVRGPWEAGLFQRGAGVGPSAFPVVLTDTVGCLGSPLRRGRLAFLGSGCQPQCQSLNGPVLIFLLGTHLFLGCTFQACTLHVGAEHERDLSGPCISRSVRAPTKARVHLVLHGS